MDEIGRVSDWKTGILIFKAHDPKNLRPLALMATVEIYNDLSIPIP